MVGKDSGHEDYIKPALKYLKQMYIGVMDKVTINSKKYERTEHCIFNIHIYPS